jgi:hypothetical protein
MPKATLTLVFCMEPPKLFKQFASPPSFPIVGRDLKPLHICIITKEFPPFAGRGGIGTLYYHLANELLLMGHHVTVIVPADSSTDPHQQIYRRGRFSLRYAKCHSICSGPLKKSSFANNVNWSFSAFHEAARIHAEHSIDVLDSALWDSEALSFALVHRNIQTSFSLDGLVTPFPVVARLNNWKLPETEIEFLKGAEGNSDQGMQRLSFRLVKSIATTVELEYGIHQRFSLEDSLIVVSLTGHLLIAAIITQTWHQIRSTDGRSIAITEMFKDRVICRSTRKTKRD